MLEFIKMFILGMLYTILFPLLVVVFACYLAYVFINYIVMESVNIFGFFFGYTFSEETDLERKLREMKEEQENGEDIEGKSPTYEYDDLSLDIFDEKGSDEQ